MSRIDEIMSNPRPKVSELRKGERLYSNVCGHRYWYFTGETLNKTGYPDWGKVTRYRLEDVCGHTEDYVAEDIERYFVVA